MKHRCQDEHDPDVVGCLGEADPAFTMDFTDIEPAPDGLLHWCSACGPRAHQMMTMLDRAFAERGDAFAQELERMVFAAEAEMVN